MTTVQTRSILTSWPALLMTTLLAATSLSAQATLTAYSANGTNLVRMQNGPVDLTLTADGNVLGSLFSANAGNPAALITQIIAATPGGAFTDAQHGTWTLSASDFGSDGRATWFGARAVVNYLNSVNYAGTNQWRLPVITDLGTVGCDFGYDGSDCGYNVNAASGELARLYHGELGRIAGFDSIGSPTSGYGIFGNDGAQTPSGAVGPFTNVRSDAYWSGVQYGLDAGTAWLFGTNDGIQTFESKEGMYFVWAVTPGEVTPVPVPAALWLFGPALLGLAGLRRRTRGVSPSAD